MTKDVCRGCQVPIIYTKECEIRKQKKSQLCPCIQCIVKVVCPTSCPEYELFCQENNIHED
jgi:hypothetical protein